MSRALNLGGAACQAVPLTSFRRFRPGGAPFRPRPRSLPCRSRAVPPSQGLYDPSFEADSCGVAFVADIKGRRTHRLVTQALIALQNMDHRGAAGAEQSSGDGAGITVQVPDAFLRASVDFDLPAAGGYAVGIAFLPTEPAEAERVRELVTTIAARRGSARARLAGRSPPTPA